MPKTPQFAGRSLTAWIIFGAIFAVGVAADLLSKSVVFNWLRDVEPETGSRAIIGGVMRFTLRTNPGGAFGLNLMPPFMVVIATVLATAFVLYFFATSPRRAHFTHTALAMILAGALGNLYDRLFSDEWVPGVGQRVRQVRDFIDFGEFYYPWVFNVADILLVVGVGILLLASLFTWRQQRHATPKGEAR